MARQVRACLADGLAAPPMVHHTSVLRGSRLLSLGGGLQSFAFGPVFSPPLGLTLGPPFLHQGQEQTARAEPPPLPRPPTHDAKAGGGIGVDRQGSGTRQPKKPPLSASGVAPHNPATSECLLVPTASTRRVKVALERAGLLDKTCRIGPSASVPGLMAVPVVSHAVPELRTLLPGRPPEVLSPEPHCTSSQPPSKAVAVFLDALGGDLSGLEHGWACQTLPHSATVMNDVHHSLAGTLREVLARSGLPLSLMETVPRRYERVGDVLLLEHTDFAGPWEAAHDSLWPVLLAAHRVTRIARVAPIQTGPKRRSQVSELDDLVSHLRM